MLAFISAPVWFYLVTKRYLDDTSESTGYDPNPGQFDILAIFVFVFATAVLGAALGVLCAIVAHIRREPELPARVTTFIANFAFMAYGLCRLAPLLLSMICVYHPPACAAAMALHVACSRLGLVW